MHPSGSDSLTLADLLTTETSRAQIKVQQVQALLQPLPVVQEHEGGEEVAVLVPHTVDNQEEPDKPGVELLRRLWVVMESAGSPSHILGADLNQPNHAIWRAGYRRLSSQSKPAD